MLRLRGSSNSQFQTEHNRNFILIKSTPNTLTTTIIDARRHTIMHAQTVYRLNTPLVQIMVLFIGRKKLLEEHIRYEVLVEGN